MEIFSSISGIFSREGGMQEDEIDKLEEELKQQKHIKDVGLSRPLTPASEDFSVSKVDFTFNVPKLALSIYTNTAGVDAKDLESNSLSKFSLNDLGLKLRMRSNGDMESDVHIKSFTVHDTRSVKDNKFSEIIPSVNHSEYQFMCNVTMTGPVSNRILKTVLTVDSPRMILALDYLFALKAFMFYGFPSSEPEDPTDSGELLLGRRKR